MQKGKAAPSPPAMVLQRGPSQQNARGPPSSQPRPEDFNQRQQQTFPISGQMPQNVVMAAIPNQMPGPPGQQSRMPNQQFYHHPRAMRIPRHQGPNNPPIYSSTPTSFVPLGNPQGGHPPFMPPGQGPPQDMSPHVDYGQIPGPPLMQYRPQQPIPGPFPPVSGPSQVPGHFVYTSQQTGYPVGQPQGPLKVFWAPAAPINTMQQYSPNPNFEPPTPREKREKKLIVIKDPNSNKDVTQEIPNPNFEQCTPREKKLIVIKDPNSNKDVTQEIPNPNFEQRTPREKKLIVIKDPNSNYAPTPPLNQR